MHVLMTLLHYEEECISPFLEDIFCGSTFVGLFIQSLELKIE